MSSKAGLYINGSLADSYGDTFTPWYEPLSETIPNWTFLAENVAVVDYIPTSENVVHVFKGIQIYNENMVTEEATLFGCAERNGYWTFEFAGVSNSSGLQIVNCP